MSIGKLGGPGGIDRPERPDTTGPGARQRPDEAEPAREDRVELSTAARTAVRLSELARGLPEIREERVRELRERIDAGEYRVDARRLARAMLELEDDGGR